MAELKSPFRYDFVGSFLRPQHLKEARAQFKAGEIDHAALTAVENEEITRLIEKQKRAGYHAITDGEFRRSYWHLDFMWGFHGIEEVELDHGYFFHGEETTHGSIKVSGKISGENHPFVEHYKFVKQFEDENCIARQTMPAPAQLLAELYREENGKNTDAVYPDHEQLLQDIAAAYRTVIQELYAVGCRNIQFDDCTWGMIGDPNYQNFLKETNTKVEDVAAEYLRRHAGLLAGGRCSGSGLGVRRGDGDRRGSGGKRLCRGLGHRNGELPADLDIAELALVAHIVERHDKLLVAVIVKPVLFADTDDRVALRDLNNGHRRLCKRVDCKNRGHGNDHDNCQQKAYYLFLHPVLPLMIFAVSCLMLYLT